MNVKLLKKMIMFTMFIIVMIHKKVKFMVQMLDLCKSQFFFFLHESGSNKSETKKEKEKNLTLLENNINIISVWFNDETEYMNDDSDSELGDYGDEDSNGKFSSFFFNKQITKVNFLVW